MMLKLFVFSLVVVVGCSGNKDTEISSPFACVVEQPAPYPNGIPYVGVHAGPTNSDWVPCKTASHFTQVWHAMKGAAVAQPNTFSPDGKFTYVTSSKPTKDDCTVWALHVEDGTKAWCRSFDEQTLWSAVEVDQDGYLYLTTGTSIVSLNSDGSDRWSTDPPVGRVADRENGAVGLHFSSTGHLITATDQGVVLALERSTGKIVASLDIPEVWGYELPPVPADLLPKLLPEKVVSDFNSLQMGGPTKLLTTFNGGGNFSDNTVSIAPNGTIYVIGGNGTEGALFQLLVTGEGDDLTIKPGWRMDTVAGSATSPGISPDGKYVKVSDGNGTATAIIDPANAGARTLMADVEACNNNTDGDKDPKVCAPALVIPLLTGPTMGTNPTLNGGVHYQYEVQVADLLNTEAPDIRAFEKDQLKWEVTLPDDLQWTSVITVTENHLLGTATRFTDSGENIMNVVELPATAQSELVILNREDGSVAFRASVTDDSTSTVTVGPDGSVYVTMLTLMHTFALDTRPVAGVIRFAPQASPAN